MLKNSLFETTQVASSEIKVTWLQWAQLFLTLVTIIIHFSFWVANVSALVPILSPNTPLLITIGVVGIPLFIQLILKLFQGDFGTDMLAFIALITGVWLGEYLAANLIILMLVGGQVLEAYAVNKASSALQELANRMPSSAHLKRGENVEDILVSDIRIGDFIVVFPHEIVPIDGVVIEGHGSMDESYLTGEPYQVSKAPGSPVLSGAVNGETALLIKAEKLAQNSRYAQILTVMEAAELKRPTLRRLGDRVGAIFAPVTLVIAFAVWFFTGDPTRFLAVLVVATPCPLLIAVPITFMSAISIAAKRGIIIRDPVILERLPICRTAIFDKTGTLTYGKPILEEIVTAEGVEKDKILQFSSSLERYSKHPLASAILQAAEKNNLRLIDAVSVSEKPGQGLTGIVGGHEIHITHRKKLGQIMPDLMANLPPTQAGLECIVLMDQAYAAIFRFRDAPRLDGKSFIGHLGPLHHFNKIMLVSGDRDSEVAYLAKLLGITETLSSQSPEQKVAVVHSETALAPTLFMGDGINDAPALASATVGIAFGHSNAVTSGAAGAVILENALIKVDELLHISISMRRIMLESVIGGMALSVLAMGFAVGGYISPAMGALLQEFIDIAAIANALRLNWDHNVKTDIEFI